MTDADPDDPERARVEALLARVAGGAATDAESEELALYAQADPQVAALARKAGRDGQLGEGWLARIQGDAALARVDHSKRARIERATGLALLAAGFAVHFTAPFLGLPFLGVGMLGLGALVLLYSVVRVRLATAADDPYKDVVR